MHNKTLNFKTLHNLVFIISIQFDSINYVSLLFLTKFLYSYNYSQFYALNKNLNQNNYLNLINIGVVKRNNQFSKSFYFNLW